MKPGRELDALIAEKVMKFKVNKVNDSLFTPDHVTRSVPHYSTDIAAAWEVVDRLQKSNPFWGTHDYGSWFHFELVPALGEWGGCWAANFGDSNCLVYGQTPAHAICLAALKVVGVEI